MIIKMKNARFCVDCETVFDQRTCDRNMNCPTCSSRSTWPLEPWLNPHLEPWASTRLKALATPKSATMTR